MQLPVASSSSTSSSTSSAQLSTLFHRCNLHGSNSLLFNCNANPSNAIPSLSINQWHRHHHHHRHQQRRRPIGLVYVGMEDADTLVGDSQAANGATATAVDDEELEPTADDLEYISQIKRVLELLKKNRDMLYGEVKLTVMIEDPREVERKRLLGIDDSDGPTRDDLVTALEEVNEGKVPGNRIALRMLAEEMTSWPNLEAEASKKTSKNRSLYAKATDTGIDPEVAAKKLKVDWDSAAEIQVEEVTDETDVPPALGYGALYLVTAFPVIIGVSVVLILFYNSLQ